MGNGPVEIGRTVTASTPLAAIPPPVRRRWLRWVPILILVCVGLALRLPGLDWMLFDFDEGVASIYALQLTGAGILPQVSVKTSFGFYNPPAFIYLISPGFLVSRDPVMAVGWLQLLTMAGWLLLWRELRRHGVGVLAATVVVGLGLMAPGPILYGRRLWGHALIPFFGLLTSVCCLRLMRRNGDRWASFLLPLLVALAQQVHFSGVLFGLSAGIVLAVLWRSPDWRWFAGGVLTALFTYVPWVLHDWRNGWQDLSMIAGLIGRGVKQAVDRTDFLAAMGALWFDFSDNTVLQKREPLFTAKLMLALPMRGIGMGLLGVSVLLSVGLPMRRILKRQIPLCRETRLLVVGLVWTLVPVAVFVGLLRVPLVPAYALVALPGPVLMLAGLALVGRKFMGRRRRVMQCAGAMGVGLFLLQGAASGEVLRATHRAMQEANPAVIHYPAWRDTRETARYLSEVTRGLPYVVISQEQLPPERGLDFQMIYALTLAEGNATRFGSRPPPGVTAVGRALTHSRARGDLLLPSNGESSPWRVRRIGLMELYWRLPPD
jgi:hypothetical protein